MRNNESARYFLTTQPLRTDPPTEFPNENSEKTAPGWLGYIGDQKLPSCIGIIISHYKDPY